MALILSLETSTTVCSVALHDHEKLVATMEIRKEHSHASKLAVLVDQVVKLADTSLSSLSAVAVAAGPGSYTGLRIGTSTAKGLCYALGIPLLAVDTLRIMAAQVQPLNWTDSILCPMIDARRMEVYCQLFDAGLNNLNKIEAKVVDEQSFEESLEANKMIFFGDGAAKCKTVIKHNNAHFLDDVAPSAVQLGYQAVIRYNNKEFEDLTTFEPFYLKEFLIKKPVNKEQA
ncbi:MAG TPA: tRNA (adenosine(37)-N6)-threonylcarbamoyltransferase complex dimerization subunit type 1 TsaB [Ohtaekwangia sp.]|uniref:tRNA (adenosine(37)-N6)-threonylcarbamoyltransferase complex dimerization subunit type 1 TsaB n=1 Tax=Ohtaekwangia sp. TaxID=2066019 RepID=UPI002F93FEC3